MIIICIHTINRNRTCTLRHFTFHQAHTIHFISLCKDTYCCTICKSILIVIQVKDLNSVLFKNCFLRNCDRSFCCEVSIFHIIFFKRCIICFDQRTICHFKSRHKSNRNHKKNTYHNILSKIIFQFTNISFMQRILHITTPILPHELSVGFV